MPYKLSPKWRLTVFILIVALALAIISSSFIPSRAADSEFVGSLSGELVPNTGDLDQIIFRPVRDLSKIKFATPPEHGVNITAGRLYDPLRDKSAILTLLVEAEDEQPYIYVDLDLDNLMADAERFPLEREENGNPYILQTTVQLPFKNALFKS